MNIWTKIDAIVSSINLIAVRDDDDARGSQNERVPKTFLFPAKKVAGERSAPWHGTKEIIRKSQCIFVKEEEEGKRGWHGSVREARDLESK